MKFKVGQAVEWTSSNTAKAGVVVAVVPAGRKPADLGYPHVGKDSLRRDRESYVVNGGVPGGRQADYWPLVSLLREAGGLSPREVAWCHENSDAVRGLIAAHGGPRP